MGYTENEILLRCEEALKDARTFYQRDFVNYRGKSTDTNEYYTEIIAKFIYVHIDCYQSGIPKITRKTSYKTEGHNGNYSKTSNREEEIIAMRLFNQSNCNGALDYIGKVIDYQTPLKSARTDIAGKIDVLSYDGKTLRVLELKKPDSSETMLRCVLEGYTYMKTADRDKLLADFELPGDTEFVASPFVFWGGVQYQEFKENRIWLKKLMNLLGSSPFYIKGNEEYSVVEEKL